MFWIKVDVAEDGQVCVSTHGNIHTVTENIPSQTKIRVRRGNTVSQALRSLAAAMVTAKAELIEEVKP